MHKIIRPKLAIDFVKATLTENLREFTSNLFCGTKKLTPNNYKKNLFSKF